MNSIRAILFTFFMGLSAVVQAQESQVTYFAGGCFWCVQEAFDKIPGVEKTVVGYMGGQQPNPSYEQVASGQTQHIESVQVFYQPEKVSYPDLLKNFWLNVDPTQANGQFCDEGAQYRSAIFVSNRAEEEVAMQSKSLLESIFDNVYTQIIPAKDFYPAEQYHQNYYKKNPIRYRFYKYRCGRTSRLESVWTQAHIEQFDKSF